MPAHVRRNYGTAHQRTRQAWAPAVATGTIRCWRCNQYITALQHWDLGHRDALPSHPEHRECNRSAGATYGNTKREPRSNIW